MIIRASAGTIELVAKIRKNEMTHDLVRMNFAVPQLPTREKKPERVRPKPVEKAGRNFGLADQEDFVLLTNESTEF